MPFSRAQGAIGSIGWRGSVGSKRDPATSLWAQFGQAGGDIDAVLRGLGAEIADEPTVSRRRDIRGRFQILEEPLGIGGLRKDD
jgi:hypothetical protein